MLFALCMLSTLCVMNQYEEKKHIVYYIYNRTSYFQVHELLLSHWWIGHNNHEGTLSGMLHSIQCNNNNDINNNDDNNHNNDNKCSFFYLILLFL